MSEADRRKDTILDLRDPGPGRQGCQREALPSLERQPPSQAPPSRWEHRTGHSREDGVAGGLEDQLCGAVEKTQSLETGIQKTALESRGISILRTKKMLFED